MSFRASDYPPDWREFSQWVRTVRAEGRCECMGDCGLHRDHPGPRRCTERNGQPAKWARGKVILTVAHMNARSGSCRCDPKCAIPNHVRAMCQRCHLRYDAETHRASRARKRDARTGQARMAL